MTTTLVTSARSSISDDTDLAVSGSSAEVISSASISEDSFRIPRAMDILCFSPPESSLPFSPHR